MKTLLLTALFFHASFASAALFGKEGGGGGAFVCRNSAGQVTEAELVDLFEAHANGIPTAYDNATPVEAQVAAAIEKLRPVYPDFAEATRQAWTLIQVRQTGGPDVVIDPPSDVDGHYSKLGCPLEGMMYFDDVRNNLVKNTVIFAAQKTPTDLAASYLHEAIYKVMRQNSLPAGENSVLTRILVGCLVSSREFGECLGLEKTHMPENHGHLWNCHLGSTVDFYASWSEDNESWNTVITNVGGREVPYQTEVNFGDAELLPPEGKNTPWGFTGDWGYYRKGGIHGLEGLGVPYANVLPKLKVVGTRPLTIQGPGSAKKYACRLVK